MIDKYKKLIRLLKLFLSFFKLGIIGFGGGSALIPVVEKEVVYKKKWFNEDEYLKHTIIANITPGALPVKLGAVAGYEIGGGVGSILAAYAITLPGVLLTLLLLTLFSMGGENFAHYIELASVGISIFIINLLILYIMKVIKSGKKEGLLNSYIIICLISFLLTGGKEIRSLLSSFLNTDLSSINFILFDISTIDLMIISFFMILFVGLIKTRITLIIGIAISLIYALINGKNGLINNQNIFSNVVLTIMVLLVIYSLFKTVKKDPLKKRKKYKIQKQFLISIILFISIPILLFTILFVVLPSNIGNVDFAKDVAISTVTSFGGGEAYVSVADGIFVQSGLIDAGDFYSKIIAVANALPGPILVKIVSGIGYILGGSLGGLLYGWLLGAFAMSIAIAACCITALIVLISYDSLKDSEALITIKKFILPVVCGMLVSTSLSMLIEGMKITSSIGIAGFSSLPIMIIAIGILYLAHKKYKISDLIMLCGSAATSLVILM